MGRLPTAFAGRNIAFRVPYNMPGELAVSFNTTGNQFPDAVFSHQVDKPFEIHRVVPRIVALNSNDLVLGDVQPTQDLLGQLVRLFITDFGKNENLMKSPALIDVLTKGSSERTWEWAEPYTIDRSEGFTVRVDVLPAPASFAGDGIDSLKVELDFQGFLLVVGAPSENR